MFRVDYARIEAKHPTLDLLSMPLRRVLNLTYEFLLDCYAYNEEGWNNRWAPIFDPNHSDVDLGMYSGYESLRPGDVGTA